MTTKINLSTSVSQALHCLEAEAIYGELREDGYSIFISKKAYAEIVHCSVFSLIDVANYLAKTIETA